MQVHTVKAKAPNLDSACQCHTRLLRERRDPAVELMGHLQLEDLATCGMVRLEVIRGVVVAKARKALEGFFEVMQNVPADNRLWAEATEIAWQLQRKGHQPPAQHPHRRQCAQD
jgi:predicted nucleic acid-binding protein